MPLLRQDAPRGTRNPGADFCRASPVLLRRRLLRRFDPREGGQTTAPEAAPRRPWAGTSPRRETSDRNPGDRALSWLRALSCGEPYRAESLIVRRALAWEWPVLSLGPAPFNNQGTHTTCQAPRLSRHRQRRADRAEEDGSCRGGRAAQRRTDRQRRTGVLPVVVCPSQGSNLRGAPTGVPGTGSWFLGANPPGTYLRVTTGTLPGPPVLPFCCRERPGGLAPWGGLSALHPYYSTWATVVKPAFRGPIQLSGLLRADTAIGPSRGELIIGAAVL